MPVRMQLAGLMDVLSCWIKSLGDMSSSFLSAFSNFHLELLSSALLVMGLRIRNLTRRNRQQPRNLSQLTVPVLESPPVQ